MFKLKGNHTVNIKNVYSCSHQNIMGSPIYLLGKGNTFEGHFGKIWQNGLQKSDDFGSIKHWSRLA